MYRKTSDPITVWVHFSLIKSGGRRRGRPTAAPKHTLSPPETPEKQQKNITVFSMLIFLSVNGRRCSRAAAEIVEICIPG